MGFFSIFKTPVNETLDTICSAYHNTLEVTKDSSKAFISMSEEAVRQMRKHNRPQFSSAQDTFKFLNGTINDLTPSHNDNRESLECYLFNMMMYIRPDYYKPADYSKNERLKILISNNLG
jgi:hypothetical protein